MAKHELCCGGKVVIYPLVQVSTFQAYMKNKFKQHTTTVTQLLNKNHNSTLLGGASKLYKSRSHMLHPVHNACKVKTLVVDCHVKKISFSTFSGSSGAHFTDTTLQAVLNNCSDGTEVATTQRYLRASLLTFGYKC